MSNSTALEQKTLGKKRTGLINLCHISSFHLQAYVQLHFPSAIKLLRAKSRWNETPCVFFSRYEYCILKFYFFFLIDCCTFREVNSSSGLYGWVLKTFIYFICTTSMSEKDWKDYFICTGPDSILVPVVVKPEEDWRGAH